MSFISKCVYIHVGFNFVPLFQGRGNGSLGHIVMTVVDKMGVDYCGNKPIYLGGAKYIFQKVCVFGIMSKRNNCSFCCL